MKTLVNRVLRQFGYQLVRAQDARRHDHAPVPVPVSLEDQHLRNCRILANRVALLDQIPKAGLVAELGVGFGDLSARMLHTLQPREFHAIDLFGWHDTPVVWGKATTDVFSGRSHEEFYRSRFADQIRNGIVSVRKGRSWEVLENYSDEYFDLIYVDAGHDYESVKRDAGISIRKLAPSGILIFNDYTMYDHLSMVPYGVVHVVNELCVSGDLEMIYLALHEQMFCDVALRRLR